MVDPADLIAAGHQLDTVLPIPRAMAWMTSFQRSSSCLETHGGCCRTRVGGAEAPFCRDPRPGLETGLGRAVRADRRVARHVAPGPHRRPPARRSHGDRRSGHPAGAEPHLASHGQWLALDPPFADQATIGGLIATNDSGPHRHRFGTPRDLVIGIQLATTDGQLSKAGGRVVKNVAGYDLSKIASGSFGTLAAIVSATFKLAPLPGASATVVVDRLSIDRLFEVVSAMNASQLEPVAFDVHMRHPAGAAAQRSRA